jgi:F0F1-type ATP synthase epsilon subunit
MSNPNPTQNQDPKLFVRINDPDRIIFEDTAKAITSYNKRGVFDVLLYHENFITIIKQSVTIHREQQQPMVIPIETGIMKVYENSVNILVGIKTIVKDHI